MKRYFILMMMALLTSVGASAKTPVINKETKDINRVVIVEEIEIPQATVIRKTKEQLLAEEDLSQYLPTFAQDVEWKLSKVSPAVGTADEGDFIDAEQTYLLFSQAIGRYPTTRELLYTIILAEYWPVVTNKTHAVLGQEALARTYYQFCGEDGVCTHDELVWFLTSFQPFFGNPTYVDGYQDYRVNTLLRLFNSEYNLEKFGNEIYGYVDQILDHDYATSKDWIYGKWNGRPSQWYGPSGLQPKGATFGYGVDDYAITRIPYGNGYFYFVTYWQEISNFYPTPIE